MKPRPAPTLIAALSTCLFAGCLSHPEHRSFTARPGLPELVLAEDTSPEAVCLAAEVAPGQSAYASAHFTLIGWAAPEARQMAGRLERHHAEFHAALSAAGFAVHPPADRLVWLCLPGRDAFDAYAQAVDRVDMSWTAGYYSARTNRVTLMLMSPTDAADCPADAEARPIHEATHQLSFNCGLLTRGVMYPLWVSEGVATNFELGLAAPPEGNAIRCPVLVQSLVRRPLPPLADLVSATRVPADPAGAQRAYAQSWALFRFLMTHRPAELKTYLATLARLSPGRRAPQTLRSEFEAAFGPTEKIEPAWEAYLRTLGAGRSWSVVRGP